MNPPLEDLTFWEALWLPEIQPFWAGVCFVFGLFIGSFLNVCIYRLPAGLSVNKPRRSFCFRCGSMIEWFDNIPVLSYFILRGRCRQCGLSFSPRYMAVELLTGVLFLAVFLAFNPIGSSVFQFSTIWFLVFTALLIVGSFTDIDTWIIPDSITLGGAAVALIAALVIGLVDSMPLLAVFGPFPVLRMEWGTDGFSIFMSLLNGPERMNYDPATVRWWEPLANAGLGALFGSALLYAVAVLGKVVFRKDAMGMGDVKLFALIGATLGVLGALMTLFLACLLGAAGGIAGKIIAAMSSPHETSLRRGLERFPPEAEEESPASDTESADSGTEDRELVHELVEIGRNLPASSTVHHLPFGPWIAAGAVLVVVFHQQIHSLLIRWLF